MRYITYLNLYKMNKLRNNEYITNSKVSYKKQLLDLSIEAVRKCQDAFGHIPKELHTKELCSLLKNKGE